MSCLIYVQLSLMMLLQFAVWGAWSPVPRGCWGR